MRKSGDRRGRSSSKNEQKMQKQEVQKTELLAMMAEMMAERTDLQDSMRTLGGTTHSNSSLH